MARLSVHATLALAFVAMFVSGPGQSFVIAVFVDDLLDAADISRTTFSALFAIATVASACGSLALGRALDRYGVRLAWACATVGLAVAASVLSVASGIFLAALGLTLLRTSGGAIQLVGTVTVNLRYPHRRGAAVAISSLGVNAAVVVLPPLAAVLIDAYGWRTALRLIAVGTLAVAPFALAVDPRRPTGAARAAALDPPPPVPVAVRRDPSSRLPVPARSAAGLLVVFASAPFLTTGTTVHAVSLLDGRGLSRGAAAVAISCFGIGSTVLTIGLGRFADRLGTRAMLIAQAALILAGLLLLLAPVGALAYPAFVLLGLGVGFFGVASGIAWARTYGVARLGKLQGASFAAQIGASAFAPFPLATSRALTGSYTPGLVLTTAIAVAVTLVAARWREPTALPRP
jgi:MFS family permease